MGRAFSPFFSVLVISWGVAPGWYGTRLRRSKTPFPATTPHSTDFERDPGHCYLRTPKFLNDKIRCIANEKINGLTLRQKITTGNPERMDHPNLRLAAI